MNRPDFIELAYEFPASLAPPASEDYFRFPVKVAKEMGLKSCIYSLRTPIRNKKAEVLDGIEIHRFGEIPSLLLSIIARKPWITHGHSFGWIPSSIAPVMTKRFVFTPHVYRLDIYNPGLVKLVINLVKRSNAIIALSKFEASWFGEHVEKSRIHVIPHPIDFQFFSKTAEEEGNEIRKNLAISNELILTVANLVPRKNLETLLKAFRLVSQTLPKCKLVIVGSEPPTILGISRTTKPKMSYLKKLKELASALHLDGKVIFVGYQYCRDLRKFYAAANVFALPSMVEGQLLAAGEAAAAGLPLVLSNLEPLEEIYRDCALFHDPLDYCRLADHLTRILTDRRLEQSLRQMGIRRIREYDISVIKPKLKTVYENLLKMG